MGKTLILIHGSKEHSGRYTDFIKKVEENNIKVVSGNLDTHGVSHFENHNFTFESVLNSALKIIDEAYKKYPKDEYYIMGHSFGSFIVKYIVYKNIRDFKAMILSGTNNPPSSLVKLGLFLSNIGKQDKVSKFWEFAIFGNFKIASKSKNGSINWLSTDEENYNKYLKDDLCNKDFTKKSIHTMLTFIDLCSNKKTLSNFKQKNIQQLILYGKNDPVHNFGKEIKKMIKNQNKYGINNHTIVEYKESRHEILFDIEKDVVFKDLISFINQ